MSTSMSAHIPLSYTYANLLTTPNHLKGQTNRIKLPLTKITLMFEKKEYIMDEDVSEKPKKLLLRKREMIMKSIIITRLESFASY